MPMRILLILVALTLTAGAPADTTVEMIVPTGEAQKYWPRWRGPSGQGHVNGSGYVDRWSDTENVLWKAAVPGRGNSSPIVWGDYIFIATSYDDGARKSIVCFRRSDGRQLWDAVAPRSPAEMPHAARGSIRRSLVDRSS